MLWIKNKDGKMYINDKEVTSPHTIDGYTFTYVGGNIRMEKES